MSTRSFFPKRDEIERKWHLIDATDLVLGRLSSEVAAILMGKRKPQFTPSQDVGDHVVIVNASKIHLTGRKLDQKRYYRHTGYPGGIRERGAKQVQAENPDEMVMMAVRGMLPKTKLGRAMIKKLRIYKGPDHEQSAQQPQPLVIKGALAATGD